MPDYENMRKKVIDNYMKGMTKYEAMVDAGYSPNTSKSNPALVFDREDVKKEIDRRQKIMATKAQVSAQWIVDQLKSIASANLGDIIEVDEEGSPYYNFDRLSPDLKQALKGLTVDEYIEGRGKKGQRVRKIRVDLNDKLRALEMLAKHLGMFEDKNNEMKVEISLIDRLQAGRTRVAGENSSLPTGEDNAAPSGQEEQEEEPGGGGNE